MNRREFMAAILGAGAAIALPHDPDDDAEVPSVAPAVAQDRFLRRVGWMTMSDGVVSVMSGDVPIWSRFTTERQWHTDDVLAGFYSLPKAHGSIRLVGPPGTLAVVDVVTDPSPVRSATRGIRSMEELVAIVTEAQRSEIRFMLRVP